MDALVWRRAAFASTVFLATACTDLGAVRDFARTSADTADYKKIVLDYATYPERRARYGSVTPVEATERAKQQQVLLGLQDGVTTYMTALGTLAADDTVAFDVKPLTQAAAKVGVLEQATAAEVSTLGNLLLKAFAGAWQQEQVKRVIDEGNPALQKVLLTLRRYVDATQADDRQELEAIDFHYGTLERDSRDQAGVAALREWREYRETDVRSRQPSRATYLKAVDRISQGHQFLFDHRNDLSRSETVHQINLIAADLQGLAKILKL